MAQVDEALERRIQEYEAGLESLNLKGHWMPGEGKRPVFRPQLWKWDTIYTNLFLAGQLIGLDSRPHSDRRTLNLVSPGGGGRTSPNVQMSVQLVLPGEEASAHKHTFA